MKPNRDDRDAQQIIPMNTNQHHWVISIDGASRGNPGKAGAGIVMKKDEVLFSRDGFFLGIKTNNQAEYYALLLALFFIHRYAQSHDSILIFSDSELLVKQITGRYKIKNEGLQPLFALAQSLMSTYTIQVMHVMREDNTEADTMANKGINTQHPIPDSFISLLLKHGISYMKRSTA